MHDANSNARIRPMPASPIQPAMWLNLFSRQARPGLPLREQLCAALRDAIACGSLGQGERLPSTRVLAADLALSDRKSVV